MTSEYSKRWDPENGFTAKEAMKKKNELDDAHGVREPNSKWNPAEIVLDLNKKSGYKVVISTVG